MKDKKFNQEIERTIVYMVKRMQEGEENSSSVILHSIRVGMFLYDHGYGLEIVQAGFLHDIIEDSPATKEEVAKEFGEVVAGLVEVVTHDDSIKDKVERGKQALDNALNYGKNAVAIITADNIDSLDYYCYGRDQVYDKWVADNAHYYLEKFAKHLTDDKMFILLKLKLQEKGIIEHV